MLEWLRQVREAALAIDPLVLVTGGGRTELAMLFLRDTARVLIVGVAAGLLGAAGVARLLEHQLHGVRALDPTTLVIAAASIAAVALCSCWWPAVHAAAPDRTMSALGEN